MANTPMRSIRIIDEVWNPAKDAADREGDTMTDIVRRALIAYAEEHPAPKEGTAS